MLSFFDASSLRHSSTLVGRAVSVRWRMNRVCRAAASHAYGSKPLVSGSQEASAVSTLQQKEPTTNPRGARMTSNLTDIQERVLLKLPQAPRAGSLIISLGAAIL